MRLVFVPQLLLCFLAFKCSNFQLAFESADYSKGWGSRVSHAVGVDQVDVHILGPRLNQETVAQGSVGVAETGVNEWCSGLWMGVRKYWSNGPDFHKQFMTVVVMTICKKFVQVGLRLLVEDQDAIPRHVVGVRRSFIKNVANGALSLEALSLEMIYLEDMELVEANARIGSNALLVVVPDPVTCFSTAMYSGFQFKRAHCGLDYQWAS
ncbi:hypothetical protein IFM89_021815 [Coptis chinensis]|uniref:Uncharacterized protein n=1 Tax=Coptis chinensis TaxID=261450 RepID=A0A835HJ50_9MAGN|nr:hypothetical protein IFM89_021815 [Coptis chinensis]